MSMSGCVDGAVPSSGVPRPINRLPHAESSQAPGPQPQSTAAVSTHCPSSTGPKMPISITRKRAPEGSQQALKALEGLQAGGGQNRRQSACPPLGLIFAFLLIVWCCTTILSGSFFHICISSRKLNLYCISGGAGHAANDFGIAKTLKAAATNLSTSTAGWITNSGNVDSGSANDGADDQEEEEGREAEDVSTTIFDALPNSKITGAASSRSFDDLLDDGNKKGKKESAGRKMKVFDGDAPPDPSKPTVTTQRNDIIGSNSDNGKEREASEEKGRLEVAAIKMKLGSDQEKLQEPAAASISPLPFSTNINTTSTTTTSTMIKEVTDPKKEEKAIAMKVVEGQMQRIRSWVSTSRNSTSCAGRGIYVYDLPSKFNRDLMTHCHDLLPWTDLCDYFRNEAMGDPLPTLGHGWHRTHQYSLEPIFHVRVQKHPCRVYDRSEAALFYVPYYGGLDVLRWHFKNASNEVKDALGRELLQWLEGQSPWARKQGKDHMFVLGKISWDFRRTSTSGWGSSFLDMEQMRNPYKFLIERQPWEIKDVGIPHPTHFHPHSDGDIMAWQSTAISIYRKNLIGFAGAARPEAGENIRSLLIKQCRNVEGRYCKFHDCESNGCDDPEAVVALFKESEFCLQPPGDSPTRKSVFDSLVAGCIPVLFDPFTAYYQYPWHLPKEHGLYSVFIDQEEVRDMNVDVVERLRAVPAEKRTEMRRYIVYELLPRLVYGDSTAQFGRFRDAFGVVMENVMDVVTKYEE